MSESPFFTMFVDHLADIYSAEKQIVDVLPVMIKGCVSAELKDAFRQHLEETKTQVKRLDQIFRLLEVKPKVKKCIAMESILEEGSELIKEHEKSFVLDAAIIGAAQKVEHYEIASYGTLRTFADLLDLEEISDLLQETLDEEGNANSILSEIAEGSFFSSGINDEALSNQGESSNKRLQSSNKRR